MSKFLERVARTPVPAELLKEALEAIADLPAEDRQDLTGRALAVIRLLEQRKAAKSLRQRGNLVTGIHFRLEALARLHDEPAYKAWSMQSGEPGMSYVHDDLVTAAASEPLILEEHGARFDPDSFFRRVLKASEGSGRA